MYALPSLPIYPRVSLASPKERERESACVSWVCVSVSVSISQSVRAGISVFQTTNLRVHVVGCLIFLCVCPCCVVVVVASPYMGPEMVDNLVTSTTHSEVIRTLALLLFLSSATTSPCITQTRSSLFQPLSIHALHKFTQDNTGQFTFPDAGSFSNRWSFLS